MKATLSGLTEIPREIQDIPGVMLLIGSALTIDNRPLSIGDEMRIESQSCQKKFLRGEGKDFDEFLTNIRFYCIIIV
jgi:hypothetical protein